MNRFENVQRVYYQGPPQQGQPIHQEYQGQNEQHMHQFSNFGRPQQEARIHYVPDQSPSSRPATSSFFTPATRQTEVRYVTIDSQLEPQGHQMYKNPFNNEMTPHHSAILDNANIKRVTSYTHFSGYTGNIQPNMSPRMAMQQVSQ